MDIGTIIIMIGIILCFVGYVIWQIAKEGWRKIVTELIVEAEKHFTKGENKKKFNYVFNLFWDNVPKIVKKFITKTQAKKYIQNVFDSIKIALDYKNK